MFALPNALTILRILLVPVFAVAFVMPGDGARWSPSLVFVIAGISDWLDGFAARKLKAGSDFGRMLDPIADKVLVAVALMMLVAEGDIRQFNLDHRACIQPAAAGAGADHSVARDSGLGPARIPGRHAGQRAGHQPSPSSRPRCRWWRSGR